MNKTLRLLFILAIFHQYHITAQTKKVSRNWTSFVQAIHVKTDKKTKFKLEGWVKVIGHQQDSTVKAGLWARVDTNTEERGFFDNMNDRPIISDQWQQYKIEGDIGANASSINFGGICYNNGTFYFDEVQLFIQDDMGKYQSIGILNNGFESNDISQGWNQGIQPNTIVTVKEFTYGITNEYKTGKQSLLIKGKNTPKPISYNIREEEGYTPQVGTLVSMLNTMKDRVAQKVRSLDIRETDHLMDEKANRIGALIMHLAAAEAYYQVRTFERRAFNDEEKEKWQTGLSLGDEARDKFKGKPISYYLDIYKEVRKKTIEELKKRNDVWLTKSLPGSTMNNHFAWFHVMEHQSSHLGQILMLKKRIPEEENKIELPEEKVD